MLILFLLMVLPEAGAWDLHRYLMERMLGSPAASGKAYLNLKIRIPCQDEEKKELETIARSLRVNGGKVPSISATKCGKKGRQVQESTVRELLVTDWVDEPDFGMDQDLPDEFDPNGDRAWMGGVRGPTSQGFRHMVFPGFEWTSPLRTLQIPFRPVGQVLKRIEFLREASRRYLAEKNLFWGLRSLLWEIHLIQDLHQPFHVTQVPDLRMLPWSSLFKGFVGRSTVTIANFHYAYEALALEWLKENGDSALTSCLGGAETRLFQRSSELILEPRAKAPALGALLLDLLGDYPKSEGVNLPEGIGQIDTFGLIRGKPVHLDEEETDQLSRKEKREWARSTRVVQAVGGVRDLTCDLYRILASRVWAELDQAFSTVSISSNTGK